MTVISAADGCLGIPEQSFFFAACVRKVIMNSTDETTQCSECATSVDSVISAYKKGELMCVMLKRNAPLCHAGSSGGGSVCGRELCQLGAPLRWPV